MKTKIVPLFLVSFAALLMGGCEKKERTVTEVISTPQIITAASAPVLSKKEARQQEIREAVQNTTAVTVDFRSIEGRKLGGLYADIVGVNGTVGASHLVNYNEQLANLWVRKLDRNVVSEATIKNAAVPIELYKNDPRKMTLVQFVDEANKQVSLVKAKINYSAACAGYKLDPAECAIWQALARDVRGLDLVAYGLTELMPSAEGELNVKILDIILRNAGSNYMFTIPALYDSRLSLGFYQFTSYAVNGSSNFGASRMNQYLSKDAHIPGSVIALHNGEHHRAAYLFALDNFANLARRTNVKEFDALKRALKQKPGDIVTFMAVAHHAPGLALKCTKHWLSKGAKKSLNEHLVGRLKAYGRKSDNNLRALENLVK